MPKTYFVISDIHSFYGPMRQALWQAGFRRTNKDHVLICCGDLFDRGPESIMVYEYIKSLPKSRRILIRGNHEDLFLDLALKTRLPYGRDFSNGTVKTFCEIAGADYQLISLLYFGVTLSMVREAWYEVQRTVRDSEITRWLQSDEWVDFYEVDKYICVHSFIPIHINKEKTSLSQPRRRGKYNPDWRVASTEEEKEYARWGCPFEQLDAGYFDTEIAKGKVLVCGHWRASDFHDHYEGESDTYNNNIYIGDHLIALDACTVVSDKLNVFKFQSPLS